MYNTYLGLLLSIICLLVAYFWLSKLILVTVLCVILAVLYFKDDFTIFRYLATHVASFYSWGCEILSSIQNMYHQSNNSNFPVRKCIENNGIMSNKYGRLNQGSSYNLSSSYLDTHSCTPGVWGSNSKFSPSRNICKQSVSLREMSNLKISQNTREDILLSNTRNKSSDSYQLSPISPMVSSQSVYSKNKYSPGFLNTASSPEFKVNSSNIENRPPLDAKLYADVSSPGFCSRVAERLSEEEAMTHQSKYDVVGAFPVVKFTSQSPKIKIKAPVRVRLAPPSNDLVYSNYGTNQMSRTPMMGPDESMKSVLQVLKEISRKRIHSHVDEDSEENSKRLRVTDSQFESNGMLHTSLLQQTIQGKRGREDSSPNEDDKKRRKPSQNNEILSSLSSSVSIQPPHLKTKKRKAQTIDDSINTTPVLGKLLKVQTEITPPLTANHLAAPESPVREDSNVITPPPRSVSVPTVSEPVILTVKPLEPVLNKSTEADDSGAVSRLLGRLSSPISYSAPVEVPVVKKNSFMATNDLSLSPPKENRLAAMIAVLGGPKDQSELENGTESGNAKPPERIIKGKALFSTPESPATPETPKQSKKVTFSESLTTTKIFERDQPDAEKAPNENVVTPQPNPLSSISFPTSNSTVAAQQNFNLSQANSSAGQSVTINFSSPLVGSKEPSKSDDTNINAMNTPTSSSNNNNLFSPVIQPSMFQLQSNLSVSTTPSAGPTFTVLSGPSQMSNSGASVNKSSPAFSFGSKSPLTGTENETKQSSDTNNMKPFSIGSESTAPQLVSTASFPSIFSNTTTQMSTPKTTEPENTSIQNKTTFSLFSNKDNTSSSSINNENIKLVNGFTPNTTTASPFTLSQPVSQADFQKTPFSTFGTNPTISTPQTPSLFSFSSSTFPSNSSASSNIQQTTATQASTNPPITSSASASTASSFQPKTSMSFTSTPALNMFNSPASRATQDKTSPFNVTTQNTPVFGDNVFKTVSSTIQTPSIFGNTSSQSSEFGSSLAVNATTTSNTTTQNNSIFGNAPSNKPGTFGSDTNLSSKPSAAFGFSATATSQVNSPFGITLNNNPASTSSSVFGNTTSTVQSTSVFGNVTSTTGTQGNAFSAPSITAGQKSMFSSLNNNNNSKNMFASSTNSNTFGGLNSSSTPTFGSQNSSSTSTFGSQNGSSNPTFGSQNSTALGFGSQPSTTSANFGNPSASTFAFGSQNNASNPTQSGFGGTGTFAAVSSTTSTNELKPPSFGQATPFLFGSSTTNKPSEPTKPLGTVSPFTFGSSAQQNSTGNPAQPSVQSFGSANSTFATSQPVTAFGANTTQPTAPTFQFGQGSTSVAAPAFQFSAAPPQPSAGMFSIGTGSSSRPKTAANRRRHKPT